MTRPHPWFRLLWPVLVWSGHFTVLYVGASAACAPQRVLPVTAMPPLVGLATLAALALALLPLLSRGGGDLTIAARLSAVIAGGAILFNALPWLIVPGCG